MLYLLKNWIYKPLKPIYGLYIWIIYIYNICIYYMNYIWIIYIVIITYNSKPLTRTIYGLYGCTLLNLLQNQPCSKPEPRWQIVAPRLRGPASLSGFRVFALGALALKKYGRSGFFKRETWGFHMDIL